MCFLVSYWSKYIIQNILLPKSTESLQEARLEYHPTYSRFQESEISSLQNMGEAELMWKKIYSNLWNKDINFNTSEKLTKARDQFKAVYFKVKDLFNDSVRSDGTPYFYHLLETAYILLEESGLETLCIEDILIALLHDTIEDTNQDFNSLWRSLSSKWREIAFWVHIISKPHFHTHIEDDDERSRYKNCLSEIGGNNIDLSWNIINESIVDTDLVDQYNKLKEEYKPIRNKKHFENYVDYETFKVYAKEEAHHLSFSCSDEELDIICKRSLSVKFADRLHNLRTIDHLSNQRIFKKIHETIDYIVPIAKEVNPIMAQKLQDEIQKLQTLVASRTIWNISDEVKKSTHNVTKNS